MKFFVDENRQRHSIEYALSLPHTKTTTNYMNFIEVSSMECKDVNLVIYMITSWNGREETDSFEEQKFPFDSSLFIFLLVLFISFSSNRHAKLNWWSNNVENTEWKLIKELLVQFQFLNCRKVKLWEWAKWTFRTTEPKKQQIPKTNEKKRKNLQMVIDNGSGWHTAQCQASNFNDMTQFESQLNHFVFRPAFEMVESIWKCRSEWMPKRTTNRERKKTHMAIERTDGRSKWGCEWGKKVSSGAGKRFDECAFFGAGDICKLCKHFDQSQLYRNQTDCNSMTFFVDEKKNIWIACAIVHHLFQNGKLFIFKISKSGINKNPFPKRFYCFLTNTTLSLSFVFIFFGFFFFFSIFLVVCLWVNGRHGAFFRWFFSLFLSNFPSCCARFVSSLVFRLIAQFLLSLRVFTLYV